MGERIVLVKEVRAVAGKGLEGDRYFAHAKPDSQVTLIEAEAVEALTHESGVELKPGDARRNIVTRGVALNHLVEREFRVGEVTLRGIRLCEPCAHLAGLTAQKVLPGLVHRGGLRAQILNDGVIRAGDIIQAQ
jgi:MOSC domain-containing protein YiiM